MRFTVTWRKRAFDHLAKLWIDADDRRAVQHAADTIEQCLRDDAHQAGELVAEQLRRLTVAPLTVMFETSIADRKVTVVSVALRPRA